MLRRITFSLLLAGAACTDVYPLEGLEVAPCTFAEEGGFCRAGRCEVVVPEGALTTGTTLVVQAVAVEAPLAITPVANTLCAIGPAELVFERPAELRIAFAPEEIADGFDLFDLVGFTVDEAGNITRASTTDANPTFDRVAIPIDGATRAGATIVPSDITLEKEIGRVALDVTDAASYLRNLSTHPFRGVFFDGERLYLGNGPRILVWDGIPEHGLVPPDLILGKTDLVDDRRITDAANIVGNVEDIWSDGDRIVASAGHRVLVWERRPTESGAPADLVLGQETFDTNEANLGGAPSARTLSAPDELTVDGSRLFVADTGNHRVLVWNDFPRLFAQPADLVIGQPAFDRNMLRAGAIPFYQPRGVYADGTRTLVSSSLGCTCAFGLNALVENNPLPDFTVGAENGVRRVTPTAFAQPSAMSRFGTGGLALRDASGARVSVWRDFPSAADQEPDLYVGKPDGTIGGAATMPVNAASLTADGTASGNVYADDRRLIVVDETRVLFWRTLPEVSFEPADLVIGQAGFTTAQRAIDYGGIAEDSLAHPSGLTVQGGARAIADRSNHRVLLVDGDRTVVLGQPDAEAFLANRGGGPRADTLSGPTDAVLDGDRLYVVDNGNHRVLVWDALPTEHGAAADRVIGQATFDANRPNRGAPDLDKDGDRDASADGLFFPTRAVVDGGRLYVSDTFNHRVLVFEPGATSASRVVGQPDEQRNDVNRGGGWFVKRADGFALPMGLAVADGDLYVADRENNRVLVFADVATSDDVADLVFGQPDFESDAEPNLAGATSANRGLPVSETQRRATALSLHRPEDVVVRADGRVVVADTGNHRVLEYAGPFDAPPFAASVVFGQASLDERVADAGGIGATSLEGPTALALAGDRLLVADTENHRVLEFATTSTSGERPAAVAVFGQIDMLGHGIDKSAQSPGLLSNPTSVAHDGARLWVADRDHHRVLAYGPDDEPELALGQPDLSRSLPNGGGTASATTLFSPTDIYVDSERLVVADRHNHRVLIWTPPPSDARTPANIVIGQPSFDVGEPNAGRGLAAPGRDGLNAPEGIDWRDGVLYVADTGNARVLAFEDPTTGASADRVWCQSSFDENRSNRGRGAPDAETCAAPRDVTVVNDDLYVADTLNNRVLVLPRGAPSGASARMVLGQPDATSRRTLVVDAASMASPTSVAYDGSNLLVADSGHHRVLVYSLLPGGTGAAADRVIGQLALDRGVPSPDDAGLVSPSRIALVALELNDTRVYVADTQKNRVAVYRGLSRLEVD